jgi:hypothetical protein
MVMDLSKINSQVVDEEIRLGIYVWLIDGKWVGTDDGDFLSITSIKGNKENIELLRKAVASYGIDRGEPFFLPGRRKIDDEEFEYQNARLRLGLTPDPLDMGEYKDQMRALRRGQNPIK